MFYVDFHPAPSPCPLIKNSMLQHLACRLLPTIHARNGGEQGDMPRFSSFSSCYSVDYHPCLPAICITGSSYFLFYHYALRITRSHYYFILYLFKLSLVILTQSYPTALYSPFWQLPCSGSSLNIKKVLASLF